MRLRILIAALALTALAAGTAPAQQDVIVHASFAAVAPPPGGPPQHTFEFVAQEMSIGSKVVKGKPYSAEAVTETNQTLADGNRITRKMTASVCRDSEGRTRREQTLGMIGPFKSEGGPLQTITIDDPVAGLHYMLDPKNKVAVKLPLPKWEQKPAAAGVAAGQVNREVRVRVVRTPGTAPSVVTEDVIGEAPVRAEGTGAGEIPGPNLFYQRIAHSDQTRTESLGAQVLEGVEAEGVRTVTTIPAGEIGNERPIEILSERWYSPQLETVVMTRNSDPRLGETIYRLTNIQRAEPPRTLFEVPPDYKIEDRPPWMIQPSQPAEKK